jgi:hypothetical protein
MSPHRAWYHYLDGGELPEMEEESDIEVSARV